MHLKKKLALSVALGFGAYTGCAAIRKDTTVPGMGDGRDYTCDLVPSTQQHDIGTPY
ncbi:hypothetical protein BFJ70_g3134 [Fusarium oxysporum]|nr:hypothetical protein BFJ70_g3134 [Fusarium oxysporum]